MVSNIIGQGKKEEVNVLIRKIVRISMGLAGILAVLINLFPRLLLSIYGQDEGFMAAAIPVLRVVTIAMMLMSFSTVWLNAVTGTGNSRVTFIIEFKTIILYSVYVYIVLEKYFLSITYGWMSEWLYWLSLFFLSWFYMRSGKWKQKVI
jgi:Na+-driven multidrug efflux pump